MTCNEGSTSLRVLPSPDPSRAILDHILFSIRTFYTPGNFDASTAISRPRFWEDTYLGIYWMKVAAHSQRGSRESRNRGFQILKKSTAGAFNVICHTTSSILLELLSTLAPVNTAASPYVRQGLLAFLHELAREQLSKCHPITLVLENLRSDNSDNDVTIRALGFIVERLHAMLGPLHELSIYGTNRLCETLRRSGDYDAALRVAQGAISAMRAILGPGSLQERYLLRQIEHVYMDQCDWVAAISVCFEVVGQRLDIDYPDPLYHDKCAVLVMEDISKSCEFAGNMEQAIAWLKQAIISGSLVWEQAEAVGHIRDKLKELLEQEHREDEFAYWVEH
ncbi:hypothetical protein PG996_007993 [Apiospora saccharicola]|uniref:Uncharacterized protein n=1 Tax=Apiospora saccharicola TaxID=335842 RepID=A0ABR1UWM5_9PEZI